MRNISVKINALVLLAIALFEAGSYKWTPILLIIDLLYLIFNNRKLYTKEGLNQFLLLGLIIAILISMYNERYTDLSKFLSVTVWGLFLILHSFCVSNRNIRQSFLITFQILSFFAILDFNLFLLLNFDLSDFLFDFSSRHISKSKGLFNLPRSTGLFGEPGTQAIPLVITFLLSDKIKRNTTLIYIFCTIIIFSPYMLLGFTKFINKKNLGKIIISLPILLVIFHQRVYDIITFEDTSFLMRIEAFIQFFNQSKMYLFESDTLYTDIGLWFELYSSYKLLGLLILLLITLKNRYWPILFILKIKAYSGWPLLLSIVKLKKRRNAE